jgi:hypothetical protein
MITRFFLCMFLALLTIWNRADGQAIPLNDTELRLELIDVISRSLEWRSDLKSYDCILKESAAGDRVGGQPGKIVRRIYRDTMVDGKECVIDVLGESYLGEKLDKVNTTFRAHFKRIFGDNDYRIIYFEPEYIDSTVIPVREDLKLSFRSKPEILICTVHDMATTAAREQVQEILDVCLGSSSENSVSKKRILTNEPIRRSVDQYLVKSSNAKVRAFNVLEIWTDPEAEGRVVRVRRASSKVGRSEFRTDDDLRMIHYDIATEWTRFSEVWVPKRISSREQRYAFDGLEVDQHTVVVAFSIARQNVFEWMEIKENSANNNGMIWTDEVLKQTTKDYLGKVRNLLL